MATIGQIIEFMNECRAVWHPLSLVDIDDTADRTPGNETIQHCVIRGGSDFLFIKQDRQRYIGHYFVWHNQGNRSSGLMLIPLNNGKYLKADYNIQL